MIRIVLLLQSLFFVGIVFCQSSIDKGITFYQKGQYQKALAIFLDLEHENKKQTDSVLLIIKNNLGNIYADLGENSKALKKYQEALTISEKNKNKKNQAKILKNIGAIYISWKNFKLAKSYYYRGLEIAKGSDDNQLIGDCYNNLGTVYEQENDLIKAQKLYFKALDQYKKINSLIDVAMVYSNLAIVFKNRGNLDKSIEFNKNALSTAILMEDLWMVSAISNNLGNSYRELKQFDSAKVYIDKSIQLSSEIKAIEIEIMAYETLSEFYQDKVDFKNALIATNKMYQLNQNFINISQTKQVNELEIKYNTKQKELENQRLIYERKQDNQRNKMIIFSLVVIFIIIILIVFFSLKFKRQKELTTHQLEINKAILESENNERFRIARDLHDSVGQMLSVVKMHISTLDNQQVNEYIDQTITEVRSISHNLIPEALNFGLKRALEELIEKISKTEKVTIQLEVESEILFDQNVELNLFRVIQELIGNSIKHSNSTKIHLKISKLNEYIEIKYDDFGNGLNAEIINNSKGIGWKNISARLNVLKAELHFKMNPNYIQIILPYNGK